MNIIIIVAVLLTATIVVRFFGTLAARSWGDALIGIGALLTFPWGIELIKTPYGGVFDANAGLTVALLLLVEWALSALRVRT
jgi:hypothetical protein